MFKALKKKLKNQKGFTLVELLAVIVILGIIAAIAIPSIGKIIDNSRDDGAVQDALQIINAAKLSHAADSSKVLWEHTGSTTGGNLDEYLTSADDETYTVKYNPNTKKFSISGHEKAAKALGKAATVELQEDVLIDAVK